MNLKKPILNSYGVRTRLLCFFLIGAIIPLMIFGSVLLAVSSREMEKQISEAYTNTSEQVNALFSEYVSKSDSIARSADVSGEVIMYLRMNMGYIDYTPEELRSAEKEAQSFLKQIVDMNPEILSVTAITLDGKMLTYSKNGYERPLYDFDDEYYDPLKNSHGNTVVLPVRKTNYQFSAPQEVFAVGFKHMDSLAYNDGVGYLNDYTGYILVECSTERLAEFCSTADIENGGAYYMLDSLNRVMYTNDKNRDIHQKEIISSVSNGLSESIAKIGPDKCLLAGSTSSETGWKVIAFVPYRNVSSRLQLIHTIFWGLCCFSLIAIVLFSIYLSKSFTNPILKMQSAMRKLRGGELSYRIEEARNDEFGNLYEDFNNLSERLNTMIDNLADARRSEETAKYHMLMSQINPHFLYNTLDSIRMMAVMKKQPEIAKSLLYLSKLFRYSIKHQDEPVTVREELSQAENYLSLQSLRFSDQLKIEYKIDPEVLELKMPKILLQPILENVFNHAFIDMEKTAEITLEIKKEADEIYFAVTDNGIGMSEEELSELYEKLQSDTLSSDSIGLFNINQRLRLHFNEKHCLKIKSRKGFGTTVSFTIPLDYRKEENI